MYNKSECKKVEQKKQPLLIKQNILLLCKIQINMKVNKKKNPTMES